MSRAEFMFRVWVPCKDDGDQEVEVWYHGLEETRIDRQFVSDWAKDAMCYEDVRFLFDLDPSKYWQVVGKAVIEGQFDYWGEYDESIDILEFQKEEVPADNVKYVFSGSYPEV